MRLEDRVVVVAGASGGIGHVVEEGDVVEEGGRSDAVLAGNR